MNLIGNILHRAKNKHGFNILTCSTHETAESILANCFPEHNWYALYHPQVKIWNHNFRECPINYHLLLNGKIPSELNIDIILSQNKFGQYQILAPIAYKYDLPLICFEHTMTMPNWTKQQIQELNNLKGHLNLFITKKSQIAWGWDDNNSFVLEHAIDTNVFQPNNKESQPYILSVCNQFSKPVRFVPCGFPLWQEIIKPNTENSLPWKHIGDQDQPWGRPAKNLSNLIEEYNNAQIFINTSQYSPIPMALLESASCGKAIVSTETCAIPDYFKHNETALLSNKPEELREYCIELLKNHNLRNRLGMNARCLIKEMFSIPKYIQSWNNILQKTKMV